MKKKSRFARYSFQDKALLMVGYILLGLFVVAIVIPMVYIIVASFIDPVTLQNKGITFDFSKWTLTAYERVLSNAQIWIGFKNAVIYSVVFTFVSVLITMLAAYPMSRADFRGRKFFNVIFVITMFFGGGLIPTYLLISNLKLLNSMWAIILPGAVSTFPVFLMIRFFAAIPSALTEAASLDGAGPWQIFLYLGLPLGAPGILSAVVLGFLEYWNALEQPMTFLKDRTIWPLSLYLPTVTAENAGASLAASVIMLTPALLIFLFGQKYLEAGIAASGMKD